MYVTPTEQMVVRPGQHVSGDGRVYHHYLARWGDAWDVSDTLLGDNLAHAMKRHESLTGGVAEV